MPVVRTDGRSLAGSTVVRHVITKSSRVGGVRGGGGLTSTPWNGNSRGWGSKGKVPSVGGYVYFLELHGSASVFLITWGLSLPVQRFFRSRTPWRSSAFLMVDGLVKYNLFGRLTVNPIHTLLVPRVLSEWSLARWPSHELLPGRRTICTLEKSKKSCRFTWTREEISFWPRDD